MKISLIRRDGSILEVDDQNLIGRGNEGKVYKSGKNLVVKIYNTPNDPTTKQGLQKQNKLQAMISNKPDTRDDDGNEILAWPQELLYEQAGNRRLLAGFTMPLVGGLDYKDIYQYWNPRMRRALPGIPKSQEGIDDLVQNICGNVVAVMSAIHQHRYIMGDINDKNCLAHASGRIAILDADSFQIPDRTNRTTYYRCTVGRPEFTSPELHDRMQGHCQDRGCTKGPDPHSRGYECVDRTMDDDRFALAVMLYKLIMNGRHPFDADTGTGYAEKIRSRQAALVRGGGYTPPDVQQRWNSLAIAWQNYFIETFTGQVYRRNDMIPGTDRIFQSRRGLARQTTVSGTQHSRTEKGTQQRGGSPTPPLQESQPTELGTTADGKSHPSGEQCDELTSQHDTKTADQSKSSKSMA